jgi:hypothetical protein
MKRARKSVEPASSTRAKALKTTPLAVEATSPHHRHRPRPTPSFLLEQQDLDDIARRRCLMILSVLSGQTPVTDAITGTEISRQNYYQMEERALRAMLRALTPGQEQSAPAGPDPQQARRIVELEQKVRELEQDKRRNERLLFLTRKVVAPGPMKLGHRGRPRKVPSSTAAGPRPLRSSKSSSGMALATPEPASTPDRTTEGGPSGGTES